MQKFKLTLRMEQRSPNSRIVEISVAASYGILLKVEAKPFLNRIFFEVGSKRKLALLIVAFDFVYINILLQGQCLKSILKVLSEICKMFWLYNYHFQLCNLGYGDFQ